VAVDSQAFKDVMSQFASGVTVVTTQLNGQHFGLTVSAFTSLSLDPPLVLICLDKKVHAHGIIEQSKVFAVNILRSDQVEVGIRFAGLRPEIQDRFEGMTCGTGVTGSPILPNCLGWIDCNLWERYDGGDHTIFVGEVLASCLTGSAGPLLYHNRAWHGSTTLDVIEPS
jgi:flavin reductase (DIM6/NTAB) family NADH-FMN oxidoreductase RutF